MNDDELKRELRAAIRDYRHLHDLLRGHLETLQLLIKQCAETQEALHKTQESILNTLGQVYRTENAWREWLQIQHGIDTDGEWWQRGDGEPPEYAG